MTASLSAAMCEHTRDLFRQHKVRDGLTQEQFGRQVGLTQSMISCILKGRRGVQIGLDRWQAIARFFGLPLSTMIAQAEGRLYKFDRPV